MYVSLDSIIKVLDCFGMIHFPLDKETKETWIKGEKESQWNLGFMVGILNNRRRFQVRTQIVGFLLLSLTLKTETIYDKRKILRGAN